MNEPKIITKTFDDLGFTVIAKPSSYKVNYKIYDVVGTDVDNKYLYERVGAEASMDTVEDLTEAQIFAHGSVKWDGCSDWHFDIQDDCMIHSCSRHGLERIGLILAACWDWTAELCEKWNP
jgi:hypothetical protein